MRRFFSEKEETTIVEKYRSGISILNTSLIYKISTWKIQQLLSKYNVSPLKNKDLRKLYSCDSSYFDKIDTKDKSYFLGLLYADGWNNEKTRKIGNEEMLNHIMNVLITNCYLNSNKLHGKKKTKSLAFHGNGVCKKLYDYLYTDCDNLYIDRKKENFETKC